MQTGGLMCAECHKQVSGVARYMKTADGLILHKDCFRCCKCRSHLPVSFFTGPNGRYCRDCMLADATVKKCKGCAGSIGRGEKFICTASGEEYHERCFLCAGCKIPLIGHFFIRSDGRLCPSCQGSDMKPKDCASCKKVIDFGEGFVHNVKGDTVHEDCFKCRVCAETMQGPFYQLFETGVCAPCQDKKAIERRCHSCKNDVAVGAPPIITTDGRCFHADCSVCQLCGVPVGGARSPLIVARHSWAGVDQNATAPVECGKCTKIVGEGEQYVHTPDGTDYHMSCFTCDSCAERIMGPFYAKSRGRFCRECVYKEDCSMFCSSCKVSPTTRTPCTSRCKGCNLQSDGSMVAVGNDSYHRSCFICSHCLHPLAGNFYQKGDDYLCKACAGK
mmetsp:Transcript_127321/g.366155  ORF Transcript_127321/g.366155 Transcript_127321/m.366155 type:complete len:389 (-) Transcript_127321:39-1205(-)